MEADMLHAAGSALLIILDPHRLIYLFAGVCMGLGLGLLPGIGGIAGTALMMSRSTRPAWTWGRLTAERPA